MRERTAEGMQRLYVEARVVVARHYRRRLTLASVAAALASSPRQVQRAYAQFGDGSFSKDLRSRRLAAAAELLRSAPSVPIADVARLVGYRQAPHFARAFRVRYGHSPARYRTLVRRRDRLQGESPPTAAAARASTPSSAGRPPSAGSGSTPLSRRRMSVPPPGAGSAVTVPPC